MSRRPFSVRSSVVPRGMYPLRWKEKRYVRFVQVEESEIQQPGTIAHPVEGRYMV